MLVVVHPRSEADAAVREQRMCELYAATAAQLRRYLVRLSGRPEDAEDLLQETMLRAWRRVDDLPAGVEARRRWMFTVARNVAIDAVRSMRARPAEVYGADGVAAAAVPDETSRLLDRQVLGDTLARLTDRQRAVLVSLYWTDRSVAETAASLGIREGTVRSRSHYALRAVRGLLSRIDPG
ncbi:sigma-70 family RNA polymerase sigma factor [Actinoplanes sp. M2I2]|uniref:sigma-70 family RNA polymerase sigma factor n=1 Tax=Actinoplanes sp. M2I2 TaxID=1734444 RepID=UPI002020B342|nr:sigma-70 family RNA polymerase sigma factor [Actinoplanes sp. M2I2]